jgi:hypothetical protein
MQDMEGGMSNVTDKDLDRLRHMLGAVSHRPKSSWGLRNYFAAGTGQQVSMRRLRDAGLVTEGSASGDLVYFHATLAGCSEIGLSKAAIKRAMEP